MNPILSLQTIATGTNTDERVFNVSNFDVLSDISGRLGNDIRNAALEGEKPVLKCYVGGNRLDPERQRLKIKSSLYLRYYAETCNEWRDHLRGLAPGQHSSEETSQRLRALAALCPMISPNHSHQYTLSSKDRCQRLQ